LHFAALSTIGNLRYNQRTHNYGHYQDNHQDNIGISKALEQRDDALPESAEE